MPHALLGFTLQSILLSSSACTSSEQAAPTSHRRSPHLFSEGWPSLIMYPEGYLKSADRWLVVYLPTPEFVRILRSVTPHKRPMLSWALVDAF